MGFDPLDGRLFNKGATGPLIVLLHGDDSKNCPRTWYMDQYAAEIARLYEASPVAQILRPGYSDMHGNESDIGVEACGESLTPGHNDPVIATIRNLQKATGAKTVIAIGHSGGAAQVGIALGKAPDLTDAAILVSCPCDVRRWREYRMRDPWLKSESPFDQIGGIDPAAQITLVTGMEDANTPTWLAADYARSADFSAARTKVVLVPGAFHGFGALSTTVLEELKVLMSRPKS